MSYEWVCGQCDSPCLVKTVVADFSPEFCPFDAKKKAVWSQVKEFQKRRKGDRRKMGIILTGSLFIIAVIVIFYALQDAVIAYGRSMALGGYWQAVDDVKERNLANSADEVIKRVQRRRNHA